MQPPIRAAARTAMRTTLARLHRPSRFILSSSLLLVGLALFSPVRGWEPGYEYLYDYNGQLVNSLGGADRAHPSAVNMIGRLIVQCIDDNTLALKLSEVRVKRQAGSAAAGTDNNNTASGSADQITRPVGSADASTDDEAVGDTVHLLSPFLVVHNKGAIVNLAVDKDEPLWSANVKKAITSVAVQLDVTGVRSESLAVFGERTSAVETFEDGVAGDCPTTLQTTRLPLYQVIEEEPRVVDNVCRNSYVYEIVKTRHLERCRNNPVQLAVTPPGSRRDKTAIQSVTYRYVVCGESPERATVVRVEGLADASFTDFGIKTSQTVRLVLQSREQIHELLPPVEHPQVFESLIYVFPEATTNANSEERRKLVKSLQQVVRSLEHLEETDVDVVARLSTVSRALSRFNGAQLRLIWMEYLKPAKNANVRDLFFDCVTASGSESAAVFMLDRVERGDIQGHQAVWALLGTGHSMENPTMLTLQRFVNILKSPAAARSKPIRWAAMVAAARLLHSSCIASESVCLSDSHVITDDFLPLLVRELKGARCPLDRLVIITVLGLLGGDDVLLLLVPYIRGDDPLEQVAAVLSLGRMMDTSPDRVIPLLVSLADNIAERPAVRVAAIATLLVHESTPTTLWQRVALRTWFEPSRHVRSFTYDLINWLAHNTLPTYKMTSDRARAVIDRVRPSDSSRRRSKSGSGMDFLSERVSSLLTVFTARHLLANLRFGTAQIEEMWQWFSGPPKSKSGNATSTSELNDVWDQLLPHQGRKQEEPAPESFPFQLIGSTLSELISAEAKWIPDFLSSTEGLLMMLDIRFVKYQQWSSDVASVPTELGLPLHLTASTSLLASVQGSASGARSSEINATSGLYWKSTSEARVHLPFSGSSVVSGVEVRAQLRGPRRLALATNESLSLLWHRQQDARAAVDLAYYRVTPYARSLRTSTDPINEHQAVAQPSITPMGFNMWLVEEGEPGPLCFDWVPVRERTYRLSYRPEGQDLGSIAVSAVVIPTVDAVINGTVDFASLGDIDNNDTAIIAPDSQHIRFGMQIHCQNTTTGDWHLQFERLSSDGNDTTAAGNIRPFNGKTDWLPALQRARSILFPDTVQCSVAADRIVTYDGVGYNYTLNGCYHVLTADCELNRYAVMARSDDSQRRIVRVALMNDIIEIHPSGEVLVNGVMEEAPRVRIHESGAIVAVVDRLSNDTIRLRLPFDDLELVVDNITIALRSSRPVGGACGLCGDGDGETTGEFKTAARCALSSGALMAASFQMSTGTDGCPSMGSKIFQELQKQTFHCSSVDEQVSSSLPLPPET